MNHIKIKNKELSSYGSAIDDIALIQLAQPIEDITPVKIQASTINEGTVLSAIGLGINRIDNNEGLRPDKLQKISLPVISYNQCVDLAHTPVTEDEEDTNAAEQPGTLISKSMLCLSARAKGLCAGDSGSAVIYQTKGPDDNPLNILKGVSIKSSDGCPFPGSPFEERPGIVVNVDEYIDFIEYAVKNGEAPKVTNLVKNGYNNEPAFAHWEISNNHNGYYYDGISFGDWSDGFFGTSHLLSQRRQVIDVLAATGQTQEELDNTVKKIEAFEFFAKSYCGGDQYGMEVTLYDKNWRELANQKTGTKTLKGSCQWHNDIWYQEKFVFSYPKGLRFIIFSDFGKDSEQWQGYYGPKMTLATVRFKTDKQSPQFSTLVETKQH